MSTYDDFADRFLAALYLETEASGRPLHPARNIRTKYGCAPAKEHWIGRMADDWEHSNFKNVVRIASGYEDWSFSISPEGARKVEADFVDDDEIRSYLGQFTPSATTKPDTATSGSVDGGIVPASDRLVRLDHNQPEYQKIARGLVDLHEQIRQDNEVGATGDQRDRLLKSLSAAKELWSSRELFLVQIRIGVLMAVEEATSAIVVLGKAVGAGMLGDQIQRFLGWDA
jgi:hypothetical protein